MTVSIKYRFGKYSLEGLSSNIVEIEFEGITYKMAVASSTELGFSAAVHWIKFELDAAQNIVNDGFEFVAIYTKDDSDYVHAISSTSIGVIVENNFNRETCFDLSPINGIINTHDGSEVAMFFSRAGDLNIKYNYIKSIF